MDASVIKEAVEHLRKEEQFLSERLNQIREIISGYQEICQHKYDDGTDAMIRHTGAKYKYEECQICGKIENL